jgi:uncharacterized phage protein gp47/JayE
MAIFPTPTQIFDKYKQILKSLKPDLNVNDRNSDFIVRGRSFTGIVSGLYGDQKKNYNDGFISSARPEALLLKGADLGIDLQPATKSESPQVRIPGTNGTVIAPGDLTFIYVPTNVLYSNTTGGTISGGVLDVSIECQITGQVGNVAAPEDLKIVSPPSGVGQTAQLLENLADGADIETYDSYRARLLSREQQPPAGGNETDYPNFAFSADSSVRSAFVRRFGRGLGTVDVYITTGTTDIDTAVTQGQSIVRIPSSIVLDAVQAYYNAHVPLTDCARVYAPTEVSVDGTVRVTLAAGLTLSSVPADPVYNPLGLNCGQLIRREFSRALYKLPVGGRVLPGGLDGYVVASDIEENLDVWLSAVKDQATGLYLGRIPILADRQVAPLDGSNYNKLIDQNKLPTPGTITVTLGV